MHCRRDRSAPAVTDTAKPLDVQAGFNLRVVHLAFVRTISFPTEQMSQVPKNEL